MSKQITDEAGVPLLILKKSTLHNQIGYLMPGKDDETFNGIMNSFQVESDVLLSVLLGEINKHDNTKMTTKMTTIMTNRHEKRIGRLIVAMVLFSFLAAILTVGSCVVYFAGFPRLGVGFFLCGVASVIVSILHLVLVITLDNSLAKRYRHGKAFPKES